MVDPLVVGLDAAVGAVCGLGGYLLAVRLRRHPVVPADGALDLPRPTPIPARLQATPPLPPECRCGYPNERCPIHDRSA